MAKYSMNCPMCSTELSVEADSEGEAATQIKEEARSHMMEAHPDAPKKDEAEMEEMIKQDMKMAE